MMILRMGMRAPASMICAMAAAFLINARIASIYLIAVILLGIVLQFIIRKANKYFNIVFEKYDDLNASVQENVSAIRVVKAYVREEYETNKFAQASAKLYNMFVRAESIIACNMPVMMFTVYSCILLISWVGAHMIVSDSLTTGNLMSLLAYCMNILMSLMMLSMVFVMISMSMASARRIAEVINEDTTLKNPEQPDMEVADGSVEFDHVYFRYKETAKDFVLKDINVAIKSGETIGIIGGTGSAKTSLVSLSAVCMMCRRAASELEARMSGNTTWRHFEMKSPLCCRRIHCSAERFTRISAGVIRMLLTRCADVRVSLPAPMNSSRRCRMATTHISSRVVRMYPADKSSVCVLRVHY